MKKVIFLSFALIIMSSMISNAQTSKKESTVSGNQIEAYYFHYNARCMTCKKVEAEAKADLLNLYGDKVNFKSLNLEDDATKPIAEKLKVSGQTLLIVKGLQTVNLTNEGFLHAVANPAKFKSIIKAKVDPMISL